MASFLWDFTTLRCSSIHPLTHTHRASSTLALQRGTEKAIRGSGEDALSFEISSAIYDFCSPTPVHGKLDCFASRSENSHFSSSFPCPRRATASVFCLSGLTLLSIVEEPAQAHRIPASFPNSRTSLCLPPNPPSLRSRPNLRFHLAGSTTCFPSPLELCKRAPFFPSPAEWSAKTVINLARIQFSFPISSNLTTMGEEVPAHVQAQARAQPPSPASTGKQPTLHLDSATPPKPSIERVPTAEILSPTLPMTPNPFLSRHNTLDIDDYFVSQVAPRRPWLEDEVPWTIASLLR